MEISERKKKILAALVEEYIQSAEPVGSKLIAEKAGLSVSSATIRNELAELTNMGFLEQPHTSAGRIPTAAGYRIYVNELMQRHRLSAEETEEINRKLDTRIHELDALMDDVGKLAAELTNYPALAVSSKSGATIQRFDLIYIDANTFIIVALLNTNEVRNKLIHLPFSVDEQMIKKLSTLFNSGFTGLTEDELTPSLIASTERAAGDGLGLVSAIAAFAINVLSESKVSHTVLAGQAKLLQLPEYRDPDKAHKLINYISDSRHLMELPMEGSEDGVKVLIGPENVAAELRDSSVVMAKYDAGDGMQGVIGVIGPTRMDYSKVAAKLSYIAEGLSKALASGSDSPLPGFGKLMLTDSGGKDKA